MYYCKQRKASSEANGNVFTPGFPTCPNGIPLPASNKVRDLGYGSVGEELEAAYARKAASHAEKIAETQVFPTLHNERKRRKSETSTLVEKNSDSRTLVEVERNSKPSTLVERNSEPSTLIDEDAGTTLGKSKRKNQQNQAAVDSTLDLQQNDVPSQSYRTMIEEEKPVEESDGLEDLWKDFSLAAECTKLDTHEDVSNEQEIDDEKETDGDCNHDIRIHEDLGHVCRICGMIVRKAETIFDYQWKKAYMSLSWNSIQGMGPVAKMECLHQSIIESLLHLASRTRTNYYESRSKDAAEIDTGTVKISEDFIVCDIAIHPRHAKQMRPHQLEGFSFLVKNLVGDKPGGCILAHAPGSGKTFMLISFIQSFLAKYPSARPLVVLPKGILGVRSSKGVADNVFTDLVEGTLLNDDNFSRKAHVIRSLRDLTKDVLHYYKGDILDELPGLVDFSVFLKLTPKQKDIVHRIEAYEKFKRSAVGTALYIHPCLSEISEGDAADRASNLTDDAVDSLVESINIRDGVKARFFYNILSLANSAGEKLLAFSQYILPMKFLERLLVKMLGWHVGKEIFMISGDTSAEDRELAMDQFNNSADAKVLFGSIKACGEGISLVGASRVIILDVRLNPSVTRQAIGRAFRPGQQKKVFVYRLVAADSPEEKFHEAAFKKEVIPKLWFEWSELCTTEDFKLNQVDIDDSEDELLEANAIRQDVKALYRR
uniref:Helicase C-terminal domain-containing protein n=1 Tax=Leersia perrieri TaxID=77586 RepID=A0A0D9VNQ6_9ORYZ